MAKVGKVEYEARVNSSKLSGDINSTEGKLKTAGENAGFGWGKAFGVAAAGVAVAAIGKVVKDSLDVGRQFDASMSQVAATMGTTVDQIKELRDFAQEMGATTAFSATQAADALNYMALAGYDAKTSMEMLPNVLNLAAAGGMELARASDMITDSQSALGLSLEETSVLVDQMAKASSKTNTSVSQLGDAILTIGGTAKVMSGGTTELTQVLGLLADNGIKGAEAGTHLRNIILSLSAPTDKAAGMLEELGVSVFDANGNMRDMQDIFTDLSDVMDKMTGEEQAYAKSIIFNKADLAAVNSLIATESDRWNEVEAELNDCAGAAEKMANTQLDNLEGSMTLFKSAVEGVQIAISDMLTPALKELVDWGGEAMQGLGDSLREGGIGGAIEYVINEVLPSMHEAGVEMLRNFADGVKEAVPEFLANALPMLKEFTGTLRANAGELIDAGLELVENLVTGIIDSLPVLIQNIPTIVSNIAGIINDNFPKIIATGVRLIGKLIAGIISSVPTLIAEFPKIIMAIVDVITAFQWVNLGKHIITFITNGVKNLFHELPNILKNIGKTAWNGVKSIDWFHLGSQIINFVVNGIKSLVTAIPTALKSIGHSALDAFKNIDWWGLGKAVIAGIASGISGGVGMVVDAAKSAAQSAFEAAKSLLGIASPSKLMRDEVGYWIPAGIAEGIEENEDIVEDSMASMIGTFTADINLPDISSYASELGASISASNSAQINVPVILDGREIARATAWYTNEQLAWEAR